MERFDRKQAYEKWMTAPGKLSVAGINDESVRSTISVLMENQERLDVRELNEDNSTLNFGSNAGDGARFSPIALALVRRVFPDLFAHKVIGVQALNAPVGLAYALRYAYDNNTAAKNAYGGTAVPGGSFGASNPWFNGGVDDYEAGFKKLSEYSGWTGAAPTVGALSGVMTSAGVLSAYTLSGANAGKFGTGETTSAAEQWLFRDGSMPKVKLFLDKIAIEAKSRKLGAAFSLESAQDLKSMQGIEIEREMLSILNYEVAAELDREILGKMIQSAVDTTKGGVAPRVINVATADGRWSQEKFANIVNSIIDMSNEIATSTLRGPGNFVIVSPKVATALQAAGPQFTAISTDVNASQTVAEIGKINGTITVYRDLYAMGDYALVGYKGPTTSDTGLIYSPYITGLFNRAIRPDDFGVNIGVMSRYAITDSLLGSGRYYRTAIIQNLSTVIS